MSNTESPNLLDTISVKLILKQEELRHVFTETNTLVEVERMIREETQELIDAIDLAINTEFSPLDVAGEVADIFVLVTKYTNKAEASLDDCPQHIQDSVDLAWDVCKSTGLDPRLCVLQKLLRNVIKYPQLICNNGYKPSEAIALSKEQYASWGGDQKFNDAYVELIEQGSSDTFAAILNSLNNSDREEFASILGFINEYPDKDAK